MLYLEADNLQCPTRALRQLFLYTLYHWLSSTSNNLFSTLVEGRSESLSRVVAVELLRSPFYLYVSLHMPTLLSVEMYH